MSRILTSSREDKCIGCGLCIMRASLLTGKTISPIKSFIRIYGKAGKHTISIDYGKNTNFKEIVDICPQNCFELKEI